MCLVSIQMPLTRLHTKGNSCGFIITLCATMPYVGWWVLFPKGVVKVYSMKVTGLRNGRGKPCH